jgi:hypothetical protein
VAALYVESGGEMRKRKTTGGMLLNSVGGTVYGWLIAFGLCGVAYGVARSLWSVVAIDLVIVILIVLRLIARSSRPPGA